MHGGEKFAKKKPDATFNSDVDNFVGVKNIKNCVIAAIIDEDYQKNIYPVGIM